MNKRRHKDRRFSLAEIVVLILAAFILMVGGVTHAWLKNSHVEVMRDADQAAFQIHRSTATVGVRHSSVRLPLSAPRRLAARRVPLGD